ncbi:unnamed protein product, partial [Meganyctiphanes norvegica]
RFSDMMAESSGDGAKPAVGVAKGSGGILWMIIWGVLLFLAAMWVAGFCAWWYIMLLPFIVCIPQAAFVTEVLLRGVQLPYFCAWNMMNQNTFAEAMATAATCVPPTVITVQKPDTVSA